MFPASRYVGCIQGLAEYSRTPKTVVHRPVTLRKQLANHSAYNVTCSNKVVESYPLADIE